MMVVCDVAATETFKSFRDRKEAVAFANRHAKTIVRIEKKYGRIFVSFTAKHKRTVWSQSREETRKRRPNVKLAPENWPEHLR